MGSDLTGDLRTLFDEAVALAEEGRPEEAAAMLRRIVEGEPAHAVSWHHLGNALQACGRLAEAEAAHRTAVRLAPASADALNNLGAVLQKQGRLGKAAASFRAALALDRKHFEARFNLGRTLMEQGAFDEAVTELERASELRPDFVPAYNQLAYAGLWRGRHDAACAWFRAAAAITQDHGRPVERKAVSKARIRHDAQQIRYLLDRGLIGPQYASYLQALERIERRASREADPAWRMTIEAAELAAIAPSFNRLLHAAEGSRLPGGTINPALDARAIEARYHEKRPELMYVDDLLTEEALQAMRRYCLESTIWKRDYPGGYLGAFMAEGFACPLLLQIAEELRVRFPAIFGEHRLHQAWAFKYDCVSQGLKMHADEAAVNVNFWITPDEANFDPDSGGLVVWDREPPDEWDFGVYNNEAREPAVLEFLEREGARGVTIPHRCNRAVIFNSNLFHCTDSFNFEDRYESRRVNVTLLYGRRTARH